MSSSKVEYVRTPESRFADIPGFDYEPKYLTRNDGLRMAYIDVSNASTDASTPETFLLLHGQPTWSYLYRKMIPVFLQYSTLPHPPARRIIAPDLLGFGRSDKPTSGSTYTFTFHRESLLHLIHQLDLRNITLVLQDWGGILGLTLPVSLPPGLVTRMVVMNTSLGLGASPGQGFLDWRAFSNRSPDMAIGKLISRGTPHLSAAELAAYDAPFPTAAFKAGVRRFPNLVPVSEDMDGVAVSRQARDLYRGGERFGGNDVFVACGMRDIVLGKDVMEGLARVWAKGCFYMEVAGAGHFVQEWGEGVAKAAVEAFETGRAPRGVRRVEPGQARL